MVMVSVWDRHEARLLIRAARRVRAAGGSFGLLAGLGLGLGVTRLFL
jgi:hypothetical protein